MTAAAARPLLVYALYGGVLYGTERMALATAQALRDDYEIEFIAPPGVVHAEAARQGQCMQCYRGLRGLTRCLARLLERAPKLVFVSTRIELSIVFWLLNLWFRRPVTHRLVVHGGGGKNVYRRNRALRFLPLSFIAVSPYVRECLVANGIAAGRVDVAENFLSDGQRAATAVRRPYSTDGIHRVAVVTRLEPVKRVDLLFDALDLEPRLAAVGFDIYGDGSLLAALRARARTHPNAVLHGYLPDAANRLAGHDLLLHLAPQEPFGLVVLEAMAAGVPALVPDRGGPAAIVADGVTGWHYRAGDARDLAARLWALHQTPGPALAAAAAAARRRLDERYSERAGAARYRELLRPPPSPP